MLNISESLICSFIPDYPALSDQIQKKNILIKISTFISAELKLLPFPINFAIHSLTILYYLLGILLYFRLPSAIDKNIHYKLCNIFLFIPFGKIYIRLIRSLTLLCFYEQDLILKKIYKNV